MEWSPPGRRHLPRRRLPLRGNLPNYATVLTVNETVGPLYFNPQAITTARRAQFGGQIDW